MAGYKCTTVCSAVQSPETDALFKKLQTTINQFAQAMIFAPIKVDGIIGMGTTTHAKLVLNNLAQMDQGPFGAQARSINEQIIMPAGLASDAQLVVDVLMLATKQPAFNATPAKPSPPAQPQPTALQLATTPANKPPSTTSPAVAAQVKDIQARNPGLKPKFWDRLPRWAPYAGGAAVALSVLAAVIASSKKRAGTSSSVPAVAGRR
jgi:hypothetical protein